MREGKEKEQRQRLTARQGRSELRFLWGGDDVKVEKKAKTGPLLARAEERRAMSVEKRD